MKMCNSAMLDRAGRAKPVPSGLQAVKCRDSVIESQSADSTVSGRYLTMFRHVSPTLFQVFCVLVAPASAVDPIGSTLQGVMIWDAEDTSSPVSPTSVGFRKKIILSETPASATLHIFADTRYLLWINGTYVARGPNRFDPKRPEYDTLNVSEYLNQGENTLAVLVQSRLSNYRFIRHTPGLGLLLETKGKDGHVLDRFATDTTWHSSASTRFGRPNVKLSGITDRVDEHREPGDWISSGFDDSNWKAAVVVEGKHWGAFQKRVIPLLRESKIDGGQILTITRSGKTEETKQSLNASMPLELAAPATAVIDMGQMVRAYFKLDFESEGESYIELRPRQSHTNRTAGFLGSCHYQTAARPGRRTYRTTDDYTCRLIHLVIHKGKVTIHSLDIVERRYPFDRVGSFRCNDGFLNQLWDMSIRTSEVNAVDGYIDGSEGGEWVTGHIDYPATRVAFAAPDGLGAPVYSDMRLLGNQISRMALSQEGDALIKGWHPSDWHRGPRDLGRGIHNFIEDSSCYWVNLLRLYYDGTEDTELVEREWPVLETVMSWFLERRTGRGLVKAREFFLHFDNPIAFHECEGATLNALAYRSLLDAAYLAERTGRRALAAQYANAANSLADAYNEHLWDESSGTYYAGLKKGEKKLLSRWKDDSYERYYASIDQDQECFLPTPQAALMALDRGLVPESRLASVQKYFLAHHCELLSPMAYLFAFNVLYQMNTDATDQEAIDTMRKRWAIMVRRKMPGTLGEQFGDKSYYCHDFGPIPAAYLSGYVLGVRRNEPIGEKRIRIEPRLGDLTEAEGVVVTRHGPVPIAWKRGTGGQLAFECTVPDGVTADFSIPLPSAAPTLTIDGETIDNATAKGRFLSLELRSGKHTGSIKP